MPRCSRASAHSDIVEPLLDALDPVRDADVRLHCPDFRDFRYVVAWTGTHVFAYAFGMEGIDLRLPPAAAAEAIAAGGRAVDGLDAGWVHLPLFGRGGRLGTIAAWVQLALRFARDEG
jgi:hypothetical protein